MPASMTMGELGGARDQPRPVSMWGASLAIGILLIVGGTIALLASVLTSLVSVLTLGGLLIGVGVLEIASAFRVRRTGPFVAYFLAGVLSAVVGGLCLLQPLASLASLTLLVGVYFLASGLFRGITSVIDRYPRWGWDLAHAVVAILLGALVVAQWPVSALWMIGTIVAAEIIVRGITLVVASLALRDQGGVGLASG